MYPSRDVNDTFYYWIECSLKYIDLCTLYIQERKGTFNKKVKSKINRMHLLANYENKIFNFRRRRIFRQGKS